MAPGQYIIPAKGVLYAQASPAVRIVPIRCPELAPELESDMPDRHADPHATTETGQRLTELLAELIAAPGVSGSEGPVAAVVERSLTDAGYTSADLWRDYLGNRWLHLGSQGPPERVLVAHMDEIGLRLTSVRPDGICRVAAVGGIDPQLWEGTPVVVHAAGGPVPGCIAPVSLHVTQRSNMGPTGRLKVEELLLDVGAGSAEEVAALGLGVLDTVTWPKGLTMLADGRQMQARSLDDRFGCCALLELARRLHNAPPSVPTVLAWAVQEEVGLRGAKALAERFGAIAEVIAVDSYTVGTGPRDNKQFDSVRLGRGPALRAWDASTLMPEESWGAVLARADELGIPLQYGFMQGGNDASVFEPTGARIIAMGVPLQYSHSNVERIHLGDLAQLCDLLERWCA